MPFISPKSPLPVQAFARLFIGLPPGRTLTCCSISTAHVPLNYFSSRVLLFCLLPHCHTVIAVNSIIVEVFSNTCAYYNRNICCEKTLLCFCVPAPFLPAAFWTTLSELTAYLSPALFPNKHIWQQAKLPKSKQPFF